MFAHRFARINRCYPIGTLFPMRTSLQAPSHASSHSNRNNTRYCGKSTHERDFFTQPGWGFGEVDVESNASSGVLCSRLRAPPITGCPELWA